MNPEISVKIDDKEIKTAPGVNLIDLAKEHGIEIPHYCYHPALAVAGNCRICFVEVEGMPHPQIACNTPVRDGMVVRTKSELAVEARKWTLEFLLANHPLDCPVCDKAGECDLQNYAFKYGRSHTDFVEKKRTPATVRLSDKLMLEKDRCIVCLRCVQFLRDVDGKEELYVHQRGNSAEIATAPGKDLESDYQLNTADICPVGALSPTNFRFAERVWNLEKRESICPLCPRGCNTKIDIKDNVVQRVVPRFNKEVNSYWMCDEGRSYFSKYHTNRRRIEGFWHRGEPIDAASFFVSVARRLQQEAATDILVLVSNWLCNEDIQAIADFVDGSLSAATISGPPFKEGGDHLLRRWDFGPNARGLRDIFKGRFHEPNKLKQSFKLALSFGVTPSKDLNIDELIYLGAYMEPFIANTLYVAPGVAHGEIHGSYTNFAGVVQSFDTFLEAPVQAHTCEEFIGKLLPLLEHR